LQCVYSTLANGASCNSGTGTCQHGYCVAL
jgi:hypothetical protein